MPVRVRRAVGDSVHRLPHALLKVRARRRETNGGGGGGLAREVSVEPGHRRAQSPRVRLVPPGLGEDSLPRIGRGQVERGASHGLVDAVGGAEEALPGHPQADERTAPRGQREATDGGVVGGERRIRTARGDLGRHTPTLSRR